MDKSFWQVKMKTNLLAVIILGNMFNVKKTLGFGKQTQVILHMFILYFIDLSFTLQGRRFLLFFK